MIVEKQNGEYLNLRIKNDQCIEKLTPIMYNKSRQYYCFFFALRNEMNKEKKHTYFAVRKTVHEIEEHGQDNSDPLIRMDTKITIITENDFKSIKDSESLKKYTQDMTFKELIDFQKEEQTWNINLTFEICFDNRSCINFIPFIYQEKKSLQTHHLLIFDIEKMMVTKHHCINTNKVARKFLRYNEFGFAIYTLTRTSDCFDQRTVNGVATKQIVKYQVGQQYYLPDEN